MTGIWEQWTAGIRRSLGASKARRSRASDVDRLVADVLRRYDPSVHALRGCRRRLCRPVEAAWGYAEAMVEGLYGPVALSPSQWLGSPLLRAVFVDADALGNLLKNTTELRSLFKGGGCPEAFVLLTATRKEKTVFTAAMESGIVHRDVARTAVEFTDHRIVAPAETEAACRERLKSEALALLTARANQEVADLKAWRRELQDERDLLSARLQAIDAGRTGFEDAPAGSGETPEQVAEARRLMNDLDGKLREVSAAVGTPEAVLDRLVQVLEHPDGVMTARTTTMTLNWMGIRLSGEEPETGDRITFSEVTFKGRLTRLAVLARVDRGDLSA